MLVRRPTPANVNRNAQCDKSPGCRVALFVEDGAGGEDRDQQKPENEFGKFLPEKRGFVADGLPNGEHSRARRSRS